MCSWLMEDGFRSEGELIPDSLDPFVESLCPMIEGVRVPIEVVATAIEIVGSAVEAGCGSLETLTC